MIARTWRGATRAADAIEYADYVRQTGVAAYRATPGNRGAYLLYRIAGERAEFLAVSLWDDLDAIRAFAGEDVTRAVFYPDGDRYLIQADERADHWEVVEGDGA